MTSNKLLNCYLYKEKKRLSKPTKPPGPFFLYCKTLDRGEADIKEFIKGASMKWKALAQEDKQVREFKSLLNLQSIKID